MIDSAHMASLAATTSLLFQKGVTLFWNMLPVTLLLAMLTLYVNGEISGGKLEGLFRRLLIAIAAIVAFPEISRAILGVENYLVDAFGGEASIAQVFAHLGDKAKDIKEQGSLSWIRVGQIGLQIITTLSFLILALIRHFLDMLHLALWNLLHVLGPIAMLGCLFTSWSQVAKGIFTGMLELALWKPIWVIQSRLLIALGFGETPQDVSQWFDTAVLNFAVAGLMASTPILVHAFLSGTLASMGGSIIQTMASGAGAVLASQPMRVIQGGLAITKTSVNQSARSAYQSVRSRISRPQQTKPNQKAR